MTTVYDLKPGSFAAACYDMNSIAELEAAKNEDPDAGDMETWHLTPEQWREQIELALAAKKADLEEEAR